MKTLASTAVVLSLSAVPAFAQGATVDNCGEPLTFQAPPERIVVHDINMTEMAFVLGLQDRMVGVTGITGWYKTTESFDEQRGDIPELAERMPTVENLVSVDPDMFFAGWYYGMQPGGEVTPDTLAPFGIQTLVLSESCVHLHDDRPEASMDLLFGDMLRLGQIMGVEDRAETLIAEWREQLAGIEALTEGVERPRVFLLDGPADAPFTSGRFAIVDAMISAAGGASVTHDMDTSWGRSSWEAVAVSNPEFLVLLDYAEGQSAADTFAYLQEHPVMQFTDAVQNERWVGLAYEELTPGPANIDAIETMARAMHPDLF